MKHVCQTTVLFAGLLLVFAACKVIPAEFDDVGLQHGSYGIAIPPRAKAKPVSRFYKWQDVGEQVDYIDVLIFVLFLFAADIAKALVVDSIKDWMRQRRRPQNAAAPPPEVPPPPEVAPEDPAGPLPRPIPEQAVHPQIFPAAEGAVGIYMDQALYITREPRKGSCVHMDQFCDNRPRRHFEIRLCSVCCKNPE